MPNAHGIILFLAAGLALNVTPGPDMLYIAGRSASEGRAAGVVSALGVGAGTLVHITLVALGLAAVLATVPVAYAVVRLAGAAYLIYLGVRVWRRFGILELHELQPVSNWTAFRQGMFTNVLNPKVALFFLAFLPQFVDPTRGSTAQQVVLLGLLFDAQGTLVNFVVAIGAGRAAERLRTARRAHTWLSRLTGTLFIGIGARLAFATRA